MLGNVLFIIMLSLEQAKYYFDPREFYTFTYTLSQTSTGVKFFWLKVWEETSRIESDTSRAENIAKISCTLQRFDE